MKILQNDSLDNWQHNLTAAISLALMVATLTLAGCNSVRLIGDYDDTIDKGVTDVQQKFELYFAKLNSTPDTAFDQNFYDDINSRLAVLKTRAMATPENQLITQEIMELQLSFDDLQKLDRSVLRPIKIDPVNKTTPFTNAKTGIEVPVESILKLEIAMKRGASPDTTQPAALPAN